MQSSLERFCLARTCVVSITGDKKLYSQAYNNLPGPLDECLRELVCSWRILLLVMQVYHRPCATARGHKGNPDPAQAPRQASTRTAPRP